MSPHLLISPAAISASGREHLINRLAGYPVNFWVWLAAPLAVLLMAGMGVLI
jgi:hypothetical protein